MADVMIKVEKNGHKHEFSQEAWDRMGKGSTRMGWTEVSEVAAPVEVQELKKKEPVVKEVKVKNKKEEEPVEENIEEVVVEEPVAEVKKKEAKKK